MSISSIQSVRPGDSSFEIYGSRKWTSKSGIDFTNRNTGPDTVSISDKAREMLGLAQADTDSAGDAAAALATYSDESAQSGGESLKARGMSLFEIMLQTMLLAELNEVEEQSRASGQGGTEQQRSLLEDSEKIKELKKAIQDVTSGKTSLADLPKLMAAASSSSSSSSEASGSVATRSAGKAASSNNSDSALA